MIVTLNIQQHQGPSFKHVCKGEAVILGRSKNADVVISDPEVSRFHARIYEEASRWFVKDLNSRNGTLLNGIKIMEPERLENGALINIGDNRVTVSIVSKNQTPSQGGDEVIDGSQAHAQTFYRDATLILKDSTGSLPIVSPELLYKHAKRLRLINEINEALGKPMSLDALLQLIMDRVFDLLSPQQGVLFLKREDGSLTPEITRNQDPSEPPFAYSQKIIDEVIGKGVAVIANDVLGDTRFSSSQSMIHSGVRALIAAPLLTGGESMGLICLVSKVGSKNFNDDDLALLVSLGSVAALRIRNLALMEEAAKRLRDDNRLLQQKVYERTAELTAMNQELQRLDAMVRVTNREVTLPRVLETVLEQGLALFYDDGSGIVFYRTDENDPFTIACSRGYERWNFENVKLDEPALNQRYLQHARELAKGCVWLKKGVPSNDPKLPHQDLCLMLALRFEQRQDALIVLDIGSDRSSFDISGADALQRFHEHAEHAFTKARMLSALEEKNAQILRAQDRLIMQEKMASLGTLTAGIAHEIKNPLNFVTNFAQECSEMSLEIAELMTRRKPDYDDEVYGEIEALLLDIRRFSSRIREHSGRADQIVMRMVSYAEKDSGTHERFDFAKLVLECSELVLSGAPSLADLREQVLIHNHDEIPRLNGNPNQLRRVVVNLVQNSVESIQAALNRHVGQWTPRIETRLHANANHIVLEISDNGVGIPDKNIKNVFTPFFTTKGPGPNLGLGLSISYDIVHLEHHGTIRVASEPNGKTVFTVELPIG